jgi:hypothetical protein
MAKLERGKGKRKQVIEITQHGVVLCMQEVDGGDARLPGYRRFSDEAAARAGLVAEVQAHLKDGMQPADDDAGALAQVHAQAQAKAGPPTLPLRQDLGIYNEANGFVATSRKMAGRILEEGSPEWNKAVRRGDMLPLELVQDDPFVIRVVAGEPLTAQEQEEWIARVDWHLNVSDGKLCVTGGSVFTTEGYDKDDPNYEGYVGQVTIPKGRYRASLYTFAHGVNGGSVLDLLAGGYDKAEDFDVWFARTRPGETRGPSENVEFIEFLLHLEAIGAAPKTGLSTLPDDGWFDGTENARKPEKCPLGIVGRDIVRRRYEEPPGKWTFVRSVFENLPRHDRKLVKGEAVSLPLDALSRAARIVWFASRFTVIELRLTPPAGALAAAIDLSGPWPEGVIAVEEGGVVRILFSADLDINATLKVLPGVAPCLAAVPDGTVMDLCSMSVDSMPAKPGDAGMLSLRGTIRNGEWRIVQAYPEVDGETLSAALALAAEIERGTTIKVRDDVEGNAILARAKRLYGKDLKSNPPSLGHGAIRLNKAGQEVALLGIATFAERFGATWPVYVFVAEGAEGDEDDEDEGDGMFPTKPIKGAQIFVAPSGRAFYQTMAMLVSEKIGTEIPKRERGLISSGFKHVGDLMCDASDKVGVRAYARPSGDTWAFFRVSFPDFIGLEIVTFAESDAVLVTSEDANQRADSIAAVKDLVARHEQSLEGSAARFAARRTAVLNMRGFAETLEARMLGH